VLANDSQTSDEQRIQLAFQKATSRSPDETERDVLQELLKESRAHFASQPTASDELLALGMSDAGGDLSRQELAAWTSVSRAILNMSETTTRN
jgi:hypothetical protein